MGLSSHNRNFYLDIYLGTIYIMHIISRKTLIDFYTLNEFRDCKGQLESWYYEAKNADWISPADVKEKYRSASILKNNRIVFNIAGNKYRIIC